MSTSYESTGRTRQKARTRLALVEALVWMTDIAGLSRREAATTMRSSARALLDATLRG